MAGYYYGRLVFNVENAKLSQQLSKDKRLDNFNGGFHLAINRTENNDENLTLSEKPGFSISHMVLPITVFD